MTKALAAPETRLRFGNLGVEAAPLETAAFRRLLADEHKTLSALIKERKIVAD